MIYAVTDEFISQFRPHRPGIEQKNQVRLKKDLL